MQNVSDKWKNNQKDSLASEGYVEISFDIADPDSLSDTSSDDNGAIYISNTAQIVSEVEKHIEPYATLEQNIWLLDGSRKNIPDSNYGDNGYISMAISNNACAFTQIPIVDISFSKVHLPIIPGITITWGAAYNEYAENFKVSAYSGSTLVAEKQIDGNDKVKSVVEIDIESYDRIQIEILKWCLPNHRARIMEIFVGINKVYTKTDIMQFELSQSVDPLTSSLPKMQIVFGVDNTSNSYDPNNITGLSKYLMERQEIRTRYGYKLDGIVEWIPGGVFYLSEWESPQNGLDASFTARDLLEFMTPTYLEGVYSPNGISLHALAEKVLFKANLPLNKDGIVKWVLDSSLSNVYTTAPLPMVSLAECLQLIANAACCVLYADRNGILHIEPINSSSTDIEINAFNSYSKTEILLTKPLQKVEVNVYQYFIADTSKQLFNGDIEVVGQRDVIITYSDKATNISAIATNGTITSATYYANSCYLKLTGNGEVHVTISGDLLKSSDSTIIIQNEEKGEIQKVENVLITSSSRALLVGEWVENHLKNRKILSSSWRADPRMDAMDIVKNQNDYNTNSTQITSLKLSYKGAFRGNCEGRVFDVVATTGL